MTEQAKDSLDKSTAFIAFALLTALLIVAGIYFYVQLAQLSARVRATGTDAAGDRLAVLEQRVAAIEGAGAPQPFKLTLFYDSGDNFTAGVLEAVGQQAASLEQQNLAVEARDVKGRLEEFRRSGFNSIPSLFINEDEARRDQRLLQAVAAQPRVAFDNESGFRIETLGFLFPRKRMLESSCKLPDGKISLHEFTNFECPVCSGIWSDRTEFVAKAGSLIEYKLRHLPLPGQYPNSAKAAEAAECARDQEKFDEYVEVAFKSHRNLTNASLKQIARTVGVGNVTRFDSCLDAGEKEQQVNRDFTEGTLTYSLNAVPVFVVDCQYAALAVTGGQLRDAICSARPDSCAALNATIAPPVPKAVGTVVPASSTPAPVSTQLNVTKVSPSPTAAA